MQFYSNLGHFLYSLLYSRLKNKENSELLNIGTKCTLVLNSMNFRDFMEVNNVSKY